MKTEQCLVLIKPDAVMKNLTGDVLSKLAETGLHMVASKVVQVSKELAEEHYQHLKEAKFFNELIDFIMGKFHGTAVIALVYEGIDACKIIREIAGATNPEQAAPHTIRGKYGRITSKGMFENVVHASENPKEAEREIKLWFRPEELLHVIYPTILKKVTLERTFWEGE